MVVWWCKAAMVHVVTNSLGIFLFLLLTSRICFTDSQNISPCTDKNDGDSCLLVCTTPDVNQAIGISQSPAYTNGGSCLGGTCYSADSLRFNISQDSISITTLEILSFEKSDNGTWRCEYGTIGTDSIFVSWSKIPASITELSGLTSNVTITADLTISVEVGCLYSLQDPIVKLQLMCDGALSTSYDMSSSPSTTVCSDSDLTAYICNYTMTSNPPSQTCNSGYTGYSLKALVSLFGTSKTYEKEIFPSFSVSFESDVTTEGPTKGLISATHSSKTTSEIESSFLEVTGTVDISNVLPSFESTDFTSKPGTSIKANTLSLEDSLPRVSSLSSIGSLGPTDMLNNEYKTTGIAVDSTLFSLNAMNFTDETITPGVLNGEISTSMVTSSRNNLQISSVSVLYITTGILFQIDFTQSRDLQIQTSEIIQNTQTQFTSLHSSVLLHTQTSNIQSSTISGSLSTRFDSRYSDALSLQSTSLDSFIFSLASKDKASTVTFSLSIETFPASPVQKVDTSSNNQLYTSGYSWSVNQTEQVPENTSIVETFTSYDNTLSSVQIASSSTEVQVLPSDTTSLGNDNSSDNLFSPVEEFSISLFLYSSSLNEGQSSIYTSIKNTLALFDVSSISLMIHSSNLSDKSVVQSSETSFSNSFSSFTDTFTLYRNDQSSNKPVSSMVVQSLNLSSSNNEVSFSSHTLSGSQFLPINGTSSSYQPKLIATSSVNHSSQFNALSEFSFPQLNTSITSQSSHANTASNDLSATSMNFLSIETLISRRSSQYLHLSTYNLNPSFDSSIIEQQVNTPFVSTEFQFTNTPLFTSLTVFLHTSSSSTLTPATSLPFETISVLGDFAKESMSTTIHSLSPLSSFSNLNMSSYTNVTSFSEIISSHSYHLVTSDINTVQPSKTVHIFSSKPTSTTTQAPELSFLEAQIMIVSCSIAFVLLVVFVPLMVMYYLGKLQRSRIHQKPRDNYDNDSSSSVTFPQDFKRDFVYDNTDIGKTLPVRYHSRTLSDLPYSWNFENNWNS